MFLSSCAFGVTSIAIIGNKQRIIVASDTLVSRTIDKKAGSRMGHECKIGILGGLIVLRAGLAEDFNRNFFPEKVAFQMFSEPGSQEFRAKEFAAAIKGPLLKSLRVLHASHLDIYRSTLPKEIALQVAVIEVHNHAPVITVITFL
jgi:hypothetical protein